MYPTKLPIFIKKFSWAAAFCLATPSLFATSLTVDVADDLNVATGGTFAVSSGDLRGVLNFINQNPDTYDVTFALGVSNTITLNAMLPILNLVSANTITMDGDNGGTQIVIDGASTFNGFFAEQGTVSLQNLTIQNVISTGGAGGDSCGGGGGGAMGAGAGLFIDQAAVTLSNVTINNASATGGAGGAIPGVCTAGGGGGGGMLGGTGGSSITTGNGGGGGGGLGGIGGDSGISDSNGGGGGINAGSGHTGAGGAGATVANGSNGDTGGGIGGAAGGLGGNGGAGNGGTGGSSGGGGGGGGASGGTGGGGGVGGAAGGPANGVGGAGNFGGGGGGGFAGGGIGGFGGGGGAGDSTPAVGGIGGFGGGGGGCGNDLAGGVGGIGGFGGGGGGNTNGASTPAGGVGGGQGGTLGGGGGGAGFGGSIFVNSPGSLTVNGSFTSGTNTTNFGTATDGGVQGWNAGNHAFFLTGSTITYDPNGSTITISSSIGDNSPASFVGAPVGVTTGVAAGAALIVGSGANPVGTMSLTSANTYSGGTTFNKGTLSIGNSTALGAGTLTFATTSGNILQSGAAALNAANAISLSVDGVVDTNGNTLTLSGNISGAGSLTKQGTGTLILSGTNSYLGDTFVSDSTLQINSTASLPSGTNVDLNGSSAILDLSPASGAFTIGDLNSAFGAANLNLGTSALTFGTATATTIFFSSITGTTASLTKNGTGAALLLGTGTFSGGTTLNQGTLAVGTGTSLGTGTLTFDTNNGNILHGQTTLAMTNPIVLNTNGVVDTGNALTLSSSISGPGILTKTGVGTLILPNANTYAGGTHLEGGTLQIGNNASIGANTLTFQISSGGVLKSGAAGLVLTNAIVINTSGAFDTNGNIMTLNGGISGTGPLVKRGAGTLILPTANTFSGTFLDLGTLQVGNNTSLGTGFVQFTAGILQSGAAGLVLPNGFSMVGSGTFDSNGNTLTLSGGISSFGGSLTKIGTGTLILSGSNTYLGGTIINVGTVQANATASLPTNRNVNLTALGTQLVLNAGVGTFTIGDLTGVAGSLINLNSNTLLFGTATASVTYAGDISGAAGSLSKRGSGIAILTGTNTYAGTTTVSVGTLEIDTTASLPSGTNVNLSGATAILNLSPAAGAFTIGNLIGISGSNLNLGTSTLTFGTVTASTTFSGSITGTSASLTKNGTGAALLLGTGTFAGGTTFNQGTLGVGTSTSLGSGTLTFATNNGNILQAGATLSMANPITLNTNGVVDSNGNTFTLSGNITGAGSLTKQGTGIAVLSGTNGYGGGTIISAGTLQINTTASLPSGTNMNISASGAQLNIASAGGSVTVGDLTGVAGSLVGLGANTLIFGTATPTVTFAGNISGASGSLTKQGIGTAVLSGTNTYTGTTTVSAGILQINSPASIPSTAAVNISVSGAQLDLASAGGAVTVGDLSGVAGGSVTLGTNNFLFGTATASTTYAGNITGTSASLTKQGSGIAILSGTNSYTGGTIISAGTLQINAVTALPSGGNVDTSASGAQLDLASAGGAVTVGDLTGVAGSSVTLGTNNFLFGTATASTTYAGNITGTSASLTKQGSGTVILSGTNAYTGGTIISAGTLQINSVASLPSGGNVNTSASGAQLNVASAGGPVTVGDLTGVAGSSVVLGANSLVLGTATPTATYAGDISGSSSSLTKQGSGIAVLSGTNAYTGGTVISAGTLQINSVASLPSGGNVNTSASGAQLDLSSAGGAITIGDLSGSSGSAVTLGANSLALGTSNSTTFAGAISGSNTLTKQGSGTFTVSGANTFTGTIAVNAGTLNVNGSFPAASTTNVASGAALSGTGTLGTVISSGTLSPGNSIGTLNVVNYTFNSGSDFLLEVSNTASDQLIASGVVTINPGSTVTLAGLGLSSPLPSYTFIHSTLPLVGSGNFTLVNTLPRFNFALQYSLNDVFLTLTSVNAFTATGNAAGVANAFNVMLATNPNAPGLSEVVDVLSLQTQSQLQDSFNQMQPANMDDMAFAEENVAERVRQTFTTRLFEQRVEACPDTDPYRLWIVPFVEHVHQRGRGDLRGYKENFRGFSTGFDYQFEKHWAITTGFSFADSDVSIVDGNAHGSFKTYAGTLGAIWTDSHFFVDGLVSYLFNTVDGKRKMRFSATGATTVQRKARHDQDTNEVMGHLGAGYDFKIEVGDQGTVNIYPFVDVDYFFLKQEGYVERGAQSLDLKVYNKDYDLLRPEGGIGMGYAGCFHRVNLNFDVTASYIREQRFLGKKTRARFEDGPKKFTVRGLNPRNNLFGTGARITITSTEDTNISLSFGYHGEFGAHFVENAGDAELRIAF